MSCKAVEVGSIVRLGQLQSQANPEPDWMVEAAAGQLKREDRHIVAETRRVGEEWILHIHSPTSEEV